jgi:pyruvate kinase
VLVISNHVNKIGMEFPKGAIVRINLAWVQDESEVLKIVEEVAPNEIWLDFPSGRRKPPVPKLSIGQAVKLANTLPPSRISYFAFSNAESVDFIDLLRMSVNDGIVLVPKIETKTGVYLIEQIARSAKTYTIMLDKEDLYVDCDGVPKLFDDHVTMARNICKQISVHCLELKGVIFA